MAAADYLSTKSEMEVRKNKNIFKNIFKRRKGFRKSPLKGALVTFVSFLVFGFIPLLAYVLQLFFSIGDAFRISIILTAVALFVLGASKCKVTNRGWFKSGFETLVVGGVAAGAAYYIGYLISGLV